MRVEFLQKNFVYKSQRCNVGMNLMFNFKQEMKVDL